MGVSQSAKETLACTDYSGDVDSRCSVDFLTGFCNCTVYLYDFLDFMNILGLSAWYHDSGACLVRNGSIVAAAQEERFTRIKHDPAFPANSIRYCLQEVAMAPRQIDFVVFYEKPFVKFERLLETYFAFAPRGFVSFASAMPQWIKDKLFQKSKLIHELKLLNDTANDVNWQDKLLFSEHHMSHAASAFYPSPFQRAAVLTFDGVGEWTTTSLALGDDHKLRILKEIHFPHSLGLLYSTFTHYLGFKVNSGEYKVMGLAPYGKPKYANLIKNNLIDICDDGSFQLDMSYFGYCTSLSMTTDKFDRLMGGPRRQPESGLSQRNMDIAASIQNVTEEVVTKLAESAADNTGERNLCLAGGVALNCVANSILLRKKIFDKIWIQPAAGDAGGALGAALAAYHQHLNQPRVFSDKRDKMQGAYLGPSYRDSEVESLLRKLGAVFHKYSEAEVVEQTANALIEGKAIGWMQGRMEFGPRALGGRSIIADPRLPHMQKQLNLKVKYRESFRPFAPSVLAENVGEWFDFEDVSPYMLFVASVHEDKRTKISSCQEVSNGLARLNISRSSVPAITHIDYSARIHTVEFDSNPRYYKLIRRFNELTGCPIIVNTSFNVRGEPIVCTPNDAVKCFMNTELDMLVIENFILHKSNQPAHMNKYSETYGLD